MNSDTSSDLNVNFLGNNENNLNVLKKDTSETDYYLNLIANPSKTLVDDPNSSSLELSDTENNEASSSSKPVFDNIKIPKMSDRESSKKSHRVSSSSPRGSSKKNRRSEVLDEFSNDHDNYEKKKKLSQKDQRMRKIELLRKLSELKLRGYKLSKEYDFNSSIEEMEYEYDMLKSFADKRNGIKLYKNLIMNGCSLVEFVNDKYDPFKFKLSGWSEHMNVEVDNYDDVLEELYEKYRGKGGSMPPELKLLLLIMASASAFHFSKNFESKIPGLNKMYTNNAGLIPGMINGKKQNQQFMSEQEMNIQRQREEMIRQEKLRKEEMMRQQRDRQQQMQQQMQQPVRQQPVRQQPVQPKPQEVSTNSLFQFGVDDNQPATINKSKNVKDILQQLHESVGTEEESSVNNDRIISDTTVSEGGTRRRRKKPMMVIT